MPGNTDEMFFRGGDEPKPAVNPDQIRIYGHRLCPFVLRAYLALAFKEIPFQKCNMELDNKAQWHIDINGGLVPIMETPSGSLVNESAVIMNFALELASVGQGAPLLPNEGKSGDLEANITAAKMRLNMQKFDGLFHGSFWSTMFHRLTNEEKNQAMLEGFAKIETLV